nr:leucine-rich repeat domain-containing protein [uncultured Porphyromonas sp.]
MKRSTLISVAIASLMSAVATNSFGNTVAPTASQIGVSTGDKVTYRTTRSTTFDDSWKNPDYSKKFQVDKLFYYVISEADKTVGVAPYSGIDNVYQYDMVVPETISYGGNTYTVVAIGRVAFANMFNLTSVKLPKTIKYIGQSAFWGSSIKSIEIPDATEEIGDKCFKEAIKLSTIKLGKGLTQVGIGAFSGCWDVKEITIAEGNTAFSNRDGALYTKDESTVIKYPSYRNNVKEVILPSTVKKIAEGAFEYCEYITDITMNEGLKEIESTAFYLCRSLKSVKIPASVEKIADGSAFCLLESCEKFEVAAGNPTFEVLMNGRLLANKQTHTAVSILYTEKREPITIPEGIEHIGDKAMLVLFENSHMEEDYRGRGPREVILPSSLKSIGAFAFSGSNLYSIKVPDAVETIAAGAFQDCQRLNYVEIGKGCKTIGDFVFSTCPALATKGKGIIRIYAEVPPKVQDIEGKSVDLDEDLVKGAQLQVPEASLSLYKKAAAWKKFRQIEKLEGQSIKEVASESLVLMPSAGVLRIENPEANQVNLYSINGYLVHSTNETAFSVELSTGIYLVSSNGKTQKVYIP